ncbi:sugar-transfer associated ATP-grasp domain-containing protein [Maribacter sp. HTCC2170]|uniref:sugar-transfer associated ATP-grasp domain-containing protein n=1 Tax=Maribacter sp. (strain HTCC2170 / KCCM 42371) TaxID=313603 RepID=UPI00006B48E2|nr:sugar-transfer associated ATP-grasp domain-containing protein [Maribacter sp. HTCC2170]EAR01093.1 putative hexapeptide transferase family protein [Maribacter sp. HTCC2170]
MKYLLRFKRKVEHRIIAPLSKFFYNRILYKKIKKLNNERRSRVLESEQIRRINSVYQKYCKKKISVQWHRFYTSCNHHFGADYIPESLFYTEIEPCLNNKTYIPALSDKNLLDLLFEDVKQPITVVKNINGLFQSDDKIISIHKAMELCNNVDEMIIKPSVDSGGGKNVRAFTGSNVGIDDGIWIQQLFDGYKKDFIIQERVTQHPLMAQFNTTSLNTFRVCTILDNSEVHLLSTIIRMGRNGTLTDNSSTGGISCGVDSEGNLNPIGFQLSGEEFHQADNGLIFESVQLPFMDKIKSTVINLHQKIPFFRMISWDLAIDDKSDIVLIEINVWGQDINFHQLNNGPVLGKLLPLWLRLSESD